MSHLGERLTALVDGELGHDDRDRALAHLALCDECRAAAESLRRVKKRLRALADAPPEGFEDFAPDLPSADFMARLQSLDFSPEKFQDGGPPAGPPPAARPGRPRPYPRKRLAGSPFPRGPEKAARRGARGAPGGVLDRPFAGPRDNRPAGGSGRAATAAVRMPRISRMPGRYLAVGAAAAAVLGLGTATFVAGGEQQRPPQVTPAFESYAVEHAVTSGDMPLTEPSASP